MIPPLGPVASRRGSRRGPSPRRRPSVLARGRRPPPRPAPGVSERGDRRGVRAREHHVPYEEPPLPAIGEEQVRASALALVGAANASVTSSDLLVLFEPKACRPSSGRSRSRAVARSRRRIGVTVGPGRQASRRLACLALAAACLLGACGTDLLTSTAAPWPATQKGEFNPHAIASLNGRTIVVVGGAATGISRSPGARTAGRPGRGRRRRCRSSGRSPCSTTSICSVRPSASALIHNAR